MMDWEQGEAGSSKTSRPRSSSASTDPPSKQAKTACSKEDQALLNAREQRLGQLQRVETMEREELRRLSTQLEEAPISLERKQREVACRREALGLAQAELDKKLEDLAKLQADVDRKQSEVDTLRHGLEKAESDEADFHINIKSLPVIIEIGGDRIQELGKRISEAQQALNERNG